ncbi:hypothetical protein LEP1GSC132_1367 [Leptospira kirschneri str. 200803703]|uniref:imm11 family protein n=1 Tax=Leptospira kirschneri TaxID=29507 RepID=UPI0002BD3F49|nr:hypothetical protein LEP1GSC132_1367 [Leptospira kirschneri str. 200803703]
MENYIQNQLSLNYLMWERENNDRHPLFDKNDTFEKARLFAYLYSDNHERREKAFSANLSLKLRIGKPKKYLMVDHHSLPQPVVSKRIKDLVELLLPNRIHWVPAEIDTDKEVYHYFIMIPPEINCLDYKKSKLHLQSDGQIFEVQEMVLDPEKLKTYSYEDRGIFRFTAGITYYLIEEQIASAIQLLNPSPSGVRFIPLADWNFKTAFH